MKSSKVMASLLSSALVFSVVVGSPIIGEAKTKSKSHKTTEASRNVDWATVNTDRIAKSLIESGQLDKDASAEEIEAAVREFILAGNVPNSDTDGIDTSTEFGKSAYKARKGQLQEFTESLEHGDDFKKSRAISKNKEHVDNAVVALIEFPDLAHNSIPKPDATNDYLWTKDFNPSHYEKVLFNKGGYRTPEGLKLPTMTDFYHEQSNGSWALDGTVTDWTVASKEAAYYGRHEGAENDADPKALVEETLKAVGKQIAGDESKYDQRDPYDLDHDGNVMEPDGMVDNLFVVHAGVGEDSGGGVLGQDAIWAHRSTLEEPVEIPGTNLKAYDYIIQGEEGAAGVFSHEYGHNLGLPDEYDTQYSGAGEPIGPWSLMSAGSWTGLVPGTEPSGFSPWAKLYFHDTYGGNWPTPKEINFDSLKEGKEYTYNLKEAVALTDKDKVLKINLDDKIVAPPTQPKGSYSYFSTKGNSLDTKLTSEEIDLTNAKSASLSFDSWFNTEEDYDFLYVNVLVDGSKKPERVKKLTGSSNDWSTIDVDLSSYAGKKIKVQFEYKTDVGLALDGAYIDNISVKVNGQEVIADDAEGDAKFTLEGFKRFDGSSIPYKTYYLVEWRTQNGVDQALGHYMRADSVISYDPGMLVWYYDGSFGEDNWTGIHPGEGYLGIVDAHQRGHYWDTNVVGDTRYQIVDAAFNLKRNKTSNIDIVTQTRAMSYKGLQGIDTFNDKNDYTAKKYLPDAGKILPKLGLTLQVKSVGKDGKSATIVVKRVPVKK
ncbi:immune inhibitor A domain-containing protein [Brevibacillus ginsengisoli]|uniref:immune inhibitor A domain-containing protein n=1 Tax=Brevibacillus ginsengisoli TaxID=363854 RepID=UPI003CF8E5CC